MFSYSLLRKETNDLWRVKSLNLIYEIELAQPDPSTFTLSLITWRG